jgi:DNA-binding NarL/FixJ family response regulator
VGTSGVAVPSDALYISNGRFSASIRAGRLVFMLPPPAIRVLVVRSRLLFGEALAFLLASQPDFKVVAHVPAIEDAVRISLTTSIQCAVVEFESGQIELSSLCDSLNTLSKHTRILLMGDVLQLQELKVLRPIVAGILPNSSNSGALIEAIRRIWAGQTWQDLPYLDGSAALPHRRYSPTLTARQQMVLHLVCEGLSNKQCAHALGVSGSSVKCTIQQLFLKTNTRSRSQLVRRAMEDLRDMVGPPPAARRSEPNIGIAPAVRFG